MGCVRSGCSMNFSKAMICLKVYAFLQYITYGKMAFKTVTCINFVIKANFVACLFDMLGTYYFFTVTVCVV